MSITGEIAKDVANPVRLYAEIAAVIALAGACWWFVAHERAIGADKIKAKDAELVAAQIIHNTEVETRANTLAKQQIADLKEKLSAPPAIDSPHLVCLPNKPRSSPVREDARPGPSTDATPQQPAVVQEPSKTDYGQDIDKRFQDDDSIIAALQQRIQDEVGVCR